MYVVVFRAQINQLDEDYSRMASVLRERAFTQYGCLDFTSACEDGNELALSYWPSLEAIQAWKADPIHLQAQKLGARKWYKSFSVEVLASL